MQDPARLDVEHVSVAYNSHPVLCDVSFQVPHGARVAVVGPNGAGKSTLFKVLVGLLPVAEGEIWVHGRPLKQHQDCVAYVPQREEVDWQFPVTVLDVVMMGRYGRLGWLRRPRAEDHHAVMEALARLGIEDLAERPISELSGGQQQRVFLARALAQEPHILLMDEPFSGVDVTTRESILRLLDQLREHQVTVLISTHDLGMAAGHFDRVLLLNRRVIAYGDATQVFSQSALGEAFGGQLLVLDGGAVVVDQCCPPDPREGGRR